MYDIKYTRAAIHTNNLKWDVIYSNLSHSGQKTKKASQKSLF